MTKTTDGNNSFAATSVYETKIFNLGDSSATKKLVSFTIITVPLLGPSNDAQVVVKYNINNNIGNSTFGTTILTHSTTGAISKTAINDSSGANLPEFKEIQFRLESTKNAIITGYKFKWEFIDKDIA